MAIAAPNQILTCHAEHQSHGSRCNINICSVTDVLRQCIIKGQMIEAIVRNSVMLSKQRGVNESG